MNDFWTLWTMDRDGYWVKMESFSRRVDAEATLPAYAGRPVQLRDPSNKVRLERVA